MGQETGPTKSLLRKLLGHNPNSIPQDKWPALAQSWAGRELEMPEETAKTNRIGEMNWFQKWRAPDAYAATSPFGTIGLNRELIEKDKQNLDEVLVHELAHVGQGKGGFLRQFYEPSQVENEAVDKEAMRKVRSKDIRLYSPRVNEPR